MHSETSLFLYLEPRTCTFRVKQFFYGCLTLRHFETSVTVYLLTRRKLREDTNILQHRCENLRSLNLAIYGRA